MFLHMTNFPSLGKALVFNGVPQVLKVKQVVKLFFTGWTS